MLCDFVAGWRAEIEALFARAEIASLKVHAAASPTRRCRRAADARDAVSGLDDVLGTEISVRAEAYPHEFVVLSGRQGASGAADGSPCPDEPGRWGQALDRLSEPLDPSESVRVSMIVPAFEKLWLTAGAVHGVLPDASGVGVEVLVAEDHSQDGTAVLPSAPRTERLRLVRQEQNLGFLGSCKAATEQAGGECLLFLSNDVIGPLGLLEGPLQATADPAACVAGARLLQLDGRLWEAGYRVLYTPFATVVPTERRSHVDDLDSGVKQHQQLYPCVIAEPWQHRLSERGLPPDRPAEYMSRHELGRTVLLIDHLTPTRDPDSGSIDTVNHMRMLRELGGHMVFWFWLAPLYSRAYCTRRYSKALQRDGIERLFRPWEDLEDWLRHNVDRVDLVVVCRVSMARKALPFVEASGFRAPPLFDTCELRFLRPRRPAKRHGDEKALAATPEKNPTELDSMARSSVALVCGSAEQRLPQEMVPNVEVVRFPLPHSVRDDAPSPGGRGRLVFIGGYRRPLNAGAVGLLVDEIWPRVHALDPGRTLIVAGAHMAAEMRAKRVSGVRFVGPVDDLDGFFEGAGVSVAVKGLKAEPEPAVSVHDSALRQCVWPTRATSSTTKGCVRASPACFGLSSCPGRSPETSRAPRVRSRRSTGPERRASSSSRRKRSVRSWTRSAPCSKRASLAPRTRWNSAPPPSSGRWPRSERSSDRRSGNCGAICGAIYTGACCGYWRAKNRCSQLGASASSSARGTSESSTRGDPGARRDPAGAVGRYLEDQRDGGKRRLTAGIG